MLVYGLPNFERENAQNIVAKKYGFSFYPVAGCLVSQELIDSTAKENNIVRGVLIKKYGKDFWSRFEKEVNKEQKQQEKVIKILSKQPFLQALEQQLNKDGNGINYYLEPTGNLNEYDANIYGWGVYNNTSARVSFYRLKVNLKSQVVSIADKIIRPL